MKTQVITPSPWSGQSLRAGIFPIQDFESLILFFGTIVFGCVGVWKGYNFTDRYPGYAGVWSQYAEAHRRYIELIEGLRDRLEVEKAEVLLKLIAVCRQLRRRSKLSSSI